MRSLRARAARSALLFVLLAAALVLASMPLAPASTAARAEEGPATVVRVPANSLVASAAAYARLTALPSIDTGARPRSTAPLYTGADDCPPPRCSDRRVPVPRTVTVTSNRVRVLLPTGYDASRNRHRRYPVVFLWNGMRNDHTSWTVKTELLSESRRWKAIFVMPAGGKGKRAGFFSDWADGSFDWETYHTRVLVPWVDATYRTVPGARASVGASVGGMGALNYAARHPGMFKSVLSVSGAVDTTLLAVEGLLGAPEGTLRPDLRRVWGDPVLDRANWNAHNPILNLKRLRGTTLFLTSGTGYAGDDEEGSVVTGEYERKLWEGHRGFLQQLTAQRIPYRARVTVGGCHFWNYFDAGIRWAMPKVIRATLR